MATEVTNRIEKLMAERDALQRLLRVVGPYAGKTTKRLTETDKTKIREATEAASEVIPFGVPVFIVRKHNCMARIDVGPIENAIAEREKTIQLLDDLNSDPNLDAYLDALDRLKQAEAALGRHKVMLFRQCINR